MNATIEAPVIDTSLADHDSASRNPPKSPVRTRRLPVAEIVEDPNQPRTAFKRAHVEELAASIREHGLLSPIKVRWDRALEKWVVVFGHARLRACRLNLMTEIDAIVDDDETDEAAVLAQQIGENEIREGMTTGELARAVERLKRLDGSNSKEIARKLGLSPAKITRLEAYLDAPAVLQELSDQGKLPDNVLYAVARHPERDAQIALAHEYLEGRKSHDEVLDVVRARVGKRERRNAGKRIAIKHGPLSVSLDESVGEIEDLLAELDALRRELRRAAERELDLDAFARMSRAKATAKGPAPGPAPAPATA